MEANAEMWGQQGRQRIKKCKICGEDNPKNRYHYCGDECLKTLIEIQSKNKLAVELNPLRIVGWRRS